MLKNDSIVKKYLKDILFTSINDYINRRDVVPYDIYLHDRYYITLWSHLPFDSYKGISTPIDKVKEESSLNIKRGFFSIKDDNFIFDKVFPKASPSIIKGVLDYR